ncbi:Mono- and diacylglycerol lipase [Hondaea fermentalgiana]|uniref:Mono-and diacylglycerol lipase n=1 Tax=Hondaea fermentalgiana TaxID=2315210 RepID=A0A2R5GBW3_9STRA|nr:Mono- and diacylglycerol lipase [Hondaea fermentalgiana]|eukprot:GBG26063.1 Mono- and diacylglycerol lipase [Hondaea fermentalgiana]
MQVSSKNPAFQGQVAQSVVIPEGEMNEGEARTSWKQNILRVFVVMGVVGVAAGVGFVVGQNSGDSADDSAPQAQTAVAEAQKTLHAAFYDDSNVAFTGNMTADNITELLDMYEADPEGWQDQFMTADIMRALQTLRDDDEGGNTEGSRELLSIPSLRREAQRELALSSSQRSLGNEAWRRISTTSYPDPVLSGSDKATVFRTSDNIYGTSGGTTGKICWVIAEESKVELGDWTGNFDLGSDPIKSIKNYYIRSERCGCQEKTLWWCSKYKQCNTYKTFQKGFDGFVKPYNKMRYAIWNRVKSKCNSNDRLVIAGYSRGAGILNALAYIVYKDNLWPLNKLVYVSFGSPRTLNDAASDQVHGKFTQLRLVYKKDPVPSVPYGWMGYKHFGTMKCNSCGYGEGRDRPHFAVSLSGFVHHLSYGTWF